MPTTVRDVDQIALATSKWGKIPHLKGTRIPFGYAVDPQDPEVLVPVIFELEALAKAKQHISEGHSLRKVSEWLSEKTGRKITHEGLRQRVRNDQTERKRADTFRRWAEALAKAILQTKKFDQKFHNNTDWADELLRDLREKVEGQA